jgi:hypothetical protein
VVVGLGAREFEGNHQQGGANEDRPY